MSSSPCQQRPEETDRVCASGPRQLGATSDGARYRALCTVVRHSRYDCGGPRQREHRQRHAPT
eukprot:7671692-Pyramimonas_sp.AAC.1